MSTSNKVKSSIDKVLQKRKELLEFYDQKLHRGFYSEKHNFLFLVSFSKKTMFVEHCTYIEVSNFQECFDIITGLGLYEKDLDAIGKKLTDIILEYNITFRDKTYLKICHLPVQHFSNFP